MTGPGDDARAKGPTRATAMAIIAIVLAALVGLFLAVPFLVGGTGFILFISPAMLIVYALAAASLALGILAFRGTRPHTPISITAIVVGCLAVAAAIGAGSINHFAVSFA